MMHISHYRVLPSAVRIGQYEPIVHGNRQHHNSLIWWSRWKTKSWSWLSSSPSKILPLMQPTELVISLEGDPLSPQPSALREAASALDVREGVLLWADSASLSHHCGQEAGKTGHHWPHIPCHCHPLNQEKKSGEENRHICRAWGGLGCGGKAEHRTSIRAAVHFHCHSV